METDGERIMSADSYAVALDAAREHGEAVGLRRSILDIHGRWGAFESEA